MNFVPGIGNPHAKLMFVGEAPGATEDSTGEPFSGSAGHLLDEFLADAGISRSDIWLTNVFKYRPPYNKIYRIKEVIPNPEEHIQKYLMREIEEVNPNCIVALGDTPLKALTKFSKVTDYRGSILLSPNTGKKVVPSIHPAAFLHQDEFGRPKIAFQMKYACILDYIRAKEESEHDRYELPQRTIDIARDSADVWKFFNQYKSERYVSIDIEVIRSIPVSVSFAFNTHHALAFPLINLYRMQSHWAIPDIELAQMQKYAIEAINEVPFVIGQNFKFDQDKLETTCAWKQFLKSLRGRIIDVTILAHALHSEFPKKLAFLSSIYTREPFYKDEGKEFDWKKKDFKWFFIYNGKDACVTYEVCFELVKELKELGQTVMARHGFPDWYENFVEGYMLKLHDFYKDMEGVGLKVDKQIKKKYFDKYTEIYKEQRNELEELAGFPCNPHSSTKDVPLLLYRELKLPPRKDVRRQTLIALLNNVAKQPRQKRCIELVLSTRRVRKARNTYYGAETDYDGRMRTGYNPNGTETGRSSTQILKPPVRPIKIGLAFQQMTKHGDIGHELREMFIPDDGYSFVEIDLSQAEARVVALLSNDIELLKKFKDGVDIHSELAYIILGMTWDGKKAPKEDRFIGKKARHSVNYDVGKHTAMLDWNAEASKQGIEDFNISEWKVGKILEKVGQANPLVKEVFHQEIQQRMIVDRYLINPFGRYRKFFGRWDNDIFREGYAHIPQSTVIDRLRISCMNARPELDLRCYRWVIEAHDSITALVLNSYVHEYASIMKKHIEVPTDFKNCSIGRGELIIPCDIQIGRNNLKEMEEFHVS